MIKKKSLCIQYIIPINITSYTLRGVSVYIYIQVVLYNNAVNNRHKYTMTAVYENMHTHTYTHTRARARVHPTHNMTVRCFKYTHVRRIRCCCYCIPKYIGVLDVLHYLDTHARS